MKSNKPIRKRGRTPVQYQQLYEGMWVVGHRGSSKEAPENSWAAFELAYLQNVNMIEFDVQFSKDKVPVIIHDDTVDRTTKERGKVSEISSKKLTGLDVGSWKNRSYNKEKMPTLEAVLKKYKEKMALNIEVKESDHIAREEIARKIIALVKKYEVEKQILISSFDHDLIHEFRNQSETIPLGFITEDEVAHNPDYFAKHSIDVWVGYWEHFTDTSVSDFRGRGVAVFAWGASKNRDLRDLIDLGVSGVIVDSPPQLLNLIKQHKLENP